MAKRYEDWAVETAWTTLAELDQRKWKAYMEADMTFLMGYASCDQFAEAALVLRGVEGDGLAEKLAADDAEDNFVLPVSLECIADTCPPVCQGTGRRSSRRACPGDGDTVDFRLCAKGYRGTMLCLGGSYPGEQCDNPLGDTHPDRCRYYLGQSQAGQVWCKHPRAVSAPDMGRQEDHMAVLQTIWR